METTLTPKEKIFILENRHELSTRDLANALGKTYREVRTYIKDNKLELSKEEIQKIRIKKYRKTRGTEDRPLEPKQEKPPQRHYKQPEWNSKPWNLGLNPVTMFRAN